MVKDRFKKFICKILKCFETNSAHTKNCFKTAADFGAIGDGSSDDTDSLQAWLNDLMSNGGCYCLGPGTYIRSKELIIKYASGFVIEGCNGTFKYKDGAPVEWGYAGIHLVNCSDFEIRNLTFDGNRANRTAAEVPAHSISMRGCTNFKLTNVRSKFAVPDGFYLSEKDGTYCENGMIENCSAMDAYRNGCSVINGRNIVFLGGHYESSGSTIAGTAGILPKTGIDVEENKGKINGSENIKFMGVTFRNNAGYGMMLTHHGEAESTKVEDCYFENNDHGAVLIAQTDVLASGCTFKNFDTVERAIIDVRRHSRSSLIRILNNLFQDISAVSTCILVQGDTEISKQMPPKPDNQMSAPHMVPSHIIISGNIFKNVSRGIVTNIEGIIIANNSLEASSDDSAAFIVNGNHCIVRDNQIKQATKCAIYVNGSDCKILDNVLIDTTVTNDQFGTIRTKNGCNDIRGNTIKLSTENRSAFAIRIADGDHVANFVKHNVIEGYKLESTWDRATYRNENIVR